MLLYIIIWAASLCALALSVKTDLRSRTIPDACSLAIAVLGAGLNVVLRHDSFWISAIAALSVFISLGVLAHFSLIGGGDVKLIASLCFLVSPLDVPALLMAIALSGGVLAVFYLAARSRLNGNAFAAAESLAPGIGRVVAAEREKIAAGEPMPYALAIASGAVITFAREVYPCIFDTSCLL